MGYFQFLFWEKMNNSSPNQQSTDCWSTVGQLSADCRLPPFTKIFCRQSAAILFMFFRDQSPRNLLCSGFLGTKPLSIPSHHPRSQEAKNLFTAAYCSFFWGVTKSEHYQLIFIIGHCLLKTWWLLKEPFL